MSDEPAFTNHIATFGNIKIKFQRNREGEVKDILEAWIYSESHEIGMRCSYSLQLILKALNSSFEELISNCKDIKDL